MNTDQNIAKQQNEMLSAMLLEWVGQAPVTIHRAFIDLTGNVLCALWLTYALEKAKAWEHGASKNGMVAIDMTSAECERDTGITRAQQQTCRKVLVQMQILSEVGGQGKAIQYTLDTHRLLDLLMQQAQPLADALRVSRSESATSDVVSPEVATAANRP